MHAAGDPLRNAALQLLVGAFLLLPFSALAGEFGQVAAGVSTRALLAVAYLVVFGSLIGYSAYVWLLHHVNASKVASHAYVNPVIAVILGSALAGEPLYVTTPIAALLILGSVYFVVREKQVALAPDEPTLREAA